MAATMTRSTELDDAVARRVEKLNTASVRRVIEPEEAFAWGDLGEGQLIPDALLSIDPDEHGLTPEQRARLSREEVASLLESGVRFETVLIAAFALQMAEGRNLVDARTTYALHEMGEETRHSRAFLRLVEHIGPTAPRLFNSGLPFFVRSKIQHNLLKHPALLYVFVLAGEEIPDLMQKLASEHPETDRLLAEVNRYHRQEEARHLAFARMRLPELHGEVSRWERWRMRHTVPFGIHRLFESMIDPGVYATVGLPPMRTWMKANRSDRRVAMRIAATRPILESVIAAGFVKEGRVPRGWRNLCHVDRHGRPRADTPTLPTVAPAPAPA
jgi:hypothetical protein